MSGSGSAVFALFEQKAKANDAAERIAGPHVHVWTARTLTFREYQRLFRTRIGR
jgi:4-diphosphocytidyl-2C-methyl-D-erythritol kinase